MAKKAPEVFRSKLGTAKGQPRSRIWIEGKRLVDAGFTVGRHFVKVVCDESHGADRRFELELLKPDDVLSTAPCKVSGKGEKPIIDITGEVVRDVFGSCGTHVDVTFAKGKIIIRPAAG